MNLLLKVKIFINHLLHLSPKEIVFFRNISVLCFLHHGLQFLSNRIPNNVRFGFTNRIASIEVFVGASESFLSQSSYLHTGDPTNEFSIQTVQRQALRVSLCALSPSNTTFFVAILAYGYKQLSH